MSTQAAIVVVAFNRPGSLSRLLGSIEKADYSGYSDIPLLISIDGGGDPAVIDLAASFEWKYGKKRILQHPENTGLKKHIIYCADLSEEYGSVIILEDDTLVSRNYYRYTNTALQYYQVDGRIAGIGLYSYQYNENAFLPFSPLIDGHEVYFMQHPCSWGQAWTWEQWKGFREWFDNDPQISFNDPMPESVKNWPESSWKKYFAKYLLELNKYFVYPAISYSTNFADPGENWSSGLPFFQVPLEQQDQTEFNFIPFDQSHNKYDAYFEVLPESLIHFGAGVDPDTCIDLYGSKQSQLITNKFLLSSKACQAPINTFGAEMKPLLQNVLNNNPGEIFKYGEKEEFGNAVPGSIRNAIWGKQHTQGYYFAGKTRYYKLGYYLLNPMKFIQKRLSK